MLGSRRVIEHGCLSGYVGPEVWAEPFPGVQIDRATDKRGQLLLNGEECQARYVAWLEVDQHVYVALRSEVVTQHRAEER
jgi:hypothetical protein